MSSILNSVTSGDLLVLKLPRDTSSNSCTKGCKPDTSSLDVNLDTGFGSSGELHYETPCKKPTLYTPLYKENFLNEFKTKEEKTLARRALGIYTLEDSEFESILNVQNLIPTKPLLAILPIKTLHKGSQSFAPVTLCTAVYDSLGNTLSSRLGDILNQLDSNKNEILKITTTSTGKNISSLGDVKLFLQGFNNGDNLRNTIDTLDKDMLRFESTGKL